MPPPAGRPRPWRQKIEGGANGPRSLTGRRLAEPDERGPRKAGAPTTLRPRSPRAPEGGPDAERIDKWLCERLGGPQDGRRYIPGAFRVYYAHKMACAALAAAWGAETQEGHWRVAARPHGVARDGYAVGHGGDIATCPLYGNAGAGFTLNTQQGGPCGLGSADAPRCAARERP